MISSLVFRNSLLCPYVYRTFLRRLKPLPLLQRLHITRNALPLDGPPARAGPHAAREAAFLEDVIHVLELEPLRLREERVHEGHPKRVEDGEDDEDAPADVRNRGRRHLDDGEDAHPVEEGRDGGAPGANTRRSDLWKESGGVSERCVAVCQWAGRIPRQDRAMAGWVGI